MPKLIDLFCRYAASNDLMEKAFIVGGSVRDIVMDQDIRDIDITVAADATAIGQAFAKEAGGAFVLLDKTYNSVRVALHNEHIDICSMRKASIIEDLGERDITINAMAIPISKYCAINPAERRWNLKSEIIDPFGGMSDINNRVIRMISSENLIKDPLRILRVFRFACSLGFSVDQSTLEAVRKLSCLIGSSASERITEELRHLLICDNTSPYLAIMYDSGLLAEILPNFSILSEEALSRLWNIYNRAEKIVNDPSIFFRDRSAPIKEFFQVEYRRACLKLSILTAEQADSKNNLKNLRLSGKEIEYIQFIYAGIKDILKLDSFAKKNIMNFLRKYDDVIYSILVYIASLDNFHTANISASDSLAYKIACAYQDEYIPRKESLPLIDGHDLIDAFGLNPSPFFKEILSNIELLALEGQISSREEALKAASRLIKEKRLFPDT